MINYKPEEAVTDQNQLNEMVEQAYNQGYARGHEDGYEQGWLDGAGGEA